MNFTCQSCHSEITTGLTAPTNDSVPYVIACRRCSGRATDAPDVKILQKEGSLTIEYVASGRQDRLKISQSLMASEGDPFRAAALPKQTIEIYRVGWFGGRDLELSESLKQVFCTKERPILGFNEVYHVEAITQSGSIIPLMKNLADLASARYIEVQIEAFLKIEDEPIHDEIKS